MLLLTLTPLTLSVIIKRQIQLSAGSSFDTLEIDFPPVPISPHSAQLIDYQPNR